MRGVSRESHVTEARAGESRERAPGARREGQSKRREREYYRSDAEVREREIRGRGMGEETSGNEGFRKLDEVLESRRSSFPIPSNVLFLGFMS